jgi:hypothetical protein
MPQGTPGQMESSPGAEVEGRGRSITDSAEADVKQSEARATKDKRIDERLAWDDETLTIRMDNKQWHIDNPKAYHVYKNIAIHSLAGCGKIRKVAIGSKVKGVQGRKTIPLLLRSLPRELYKTVRVDSQGYWTINR